jgi:uridine phosphorylase
VVITWQRTLLEKVKAERVHREVSGPAGSVFELTPDIGFAHIPIGAPVVAIVLEELAAGGVETVVAIGTAGGLAPELSPGDVVICSEALRDEGTSHHYAATEHPARPDGHLADTLRSALPDAPFGPTWTTDAPYRETVEEIAHYRAEGVLTVDMEASALFVVAEALGVRAASVFCVSDTLHGPEWEPHFQSADVGAALWKLFETAEANLRQ